MFFFRNPWVFAWTVMPLTVQAQAITDYSSEFLNNIQPLR